MAFDPDAFLLEEDEEETIQQQPAQRVPSVGFDPDAFLAEEETEFAQPTTAAQPAYQYDPSGFRRKKPVAPEEKPEEQGILRQVADIPLGIARGGVTGIKMMTDILGADNPVSKSLSGVEGYMADLMSAQAKEDQQEISRIMKDAEDKGFGEQVKAGIKAFSIAPVDIMSQALGTMAPVIATGLAGSAAKLGALGMRAVQAGVGAGMGAGMIKGEIYNEVKNELVNSGISEDAAEKAAVEAQSYGGKNLDQILLGAGLGAASTLGAEGIITRILTKQGTAPAAGVVSRVLKGGLTEAAPEAAQAAQEQLAKNVALQREGFDVDPSRGVVAAATMEAVAAAPLGGIAGAVERPAPIKTLAEENLEQTNEIARKVAENGAPLTASAIQDQAAANLRQDELAKQLEAQLEEELVAVKKPTAAPPAIQSKEEFAAIYSQVAPEELDAAEAGFTEQAATAETEEGRINAQNALEAIKGIKATVTPPAPPVAPTITPEVTPAVPTAQPPITDATQEIIQPEGVRQEPQDRVEVPAPQAGVGRGLLDTARGEEEGQVAPPAPAIPEAITRAIEERRPISAPFALQYGVDLPSGWTYEDDFFVPPATPAAEVPAVTPEPVTPTPVEPTAIVEQAPTAKEPLAVQPAEQEALLEEAKSRYDSEIATYKNQRRINLIDDQELGKKLKAAGMRFSAEKRKITGQLTEKEAEAEAKREASNYIGKLVEVEGKPGKVVGNPFGRVRVKLDESGATITTTPDKVTARSATIPTQPIISEIPPTSELVGAEPTQPTIREVPEISPIVGAEPAAIVEQEPVAPAEPAVARPSIISEASRITNELKQRWEQTAPEDRSETFNWTSRAEVELENLIGNLAGNQNAAARQNLIEEITGTKPTRQNSAIKNVRQAISGYLQANPLQETAAPTTEAAAQPAPEGVTQFAGVPPLVKELATAGRESAAQLRARISNVKMGAIEGNVETFTFDLDGQTYRGELKGRNKNLVLGTNPTADAAIATRVLLDKNATPITPVTTPPVTEAVTLVTEAAPTPAGISVGNRIKLGKSPQTYTIEEVIPQSATERELGEQYYSVKNERTGEVQTVEARDLTPVKAKPTRSELGMADKAQIDAAQKSSDSGNALELIRSNYGELSDIINKIIDSNPKIADALTKIAVEKTNRNSFDGQTVRINSSYTGPELVETINHEIAHAFLAVALREVPSFREAINSIRNDAIERAKYSDDASFRAAVKLIREARDLSSTPIYPIRENENLSQYMSRNSDSILKLWRMGGKNTQMTYEIYESAYALASNDEFLAHLLSDQRLREELKKYKVFTPDNRNLFQKFIDAVKGLFKKLAKVEKSVLDKAMEQVEYVVQLPEYNPRPIEGLGEIFAKTEPTEEIPKRRKEQVAGMEREEARYITTPEGIIKQTNDVLREKFFDGTTVSPEKTTEAWGYISRLLDIKSGAANEFAGQINDVVDQDTNSEARMGASLFSVSLANYAAKLAAQGDSKMLKFMIRNVNSMPVDKYAGGKSAAGKALRAAREYDIDGYGAIKIEVKAKIERTAATLFGTGSPTEAQFKAVEGAIKESDAQELGNPEEVAQEVEKVEKRTKRKITDKIEKIIGKGSLKGIIQAIKETPLEKQQDAGWIEKVVNDFLVNAGLSPEVAATASKLYESLIAERLAAARQKAFEDNLNKSAPWKDYLARNSRLAKDALKKIQEAIRTGALDPEQNVESIIAAESGWSGFTKDQYQKIVQLDSVINDPKQDDVTRREAMADLNKVISDAKLPVRFKDALGAYYVGNALMGIPTLTVNIASPIGFTIRNLMTDVSKFAFTDPARIPVAFETFMESMRSWYDQTSYAFKNQIYLNDVVEYLQGQNVLRELFDKGKKQWAQGKYAEGFVNMAVGMTQITGRVLSSLDQGAISMLENQNITRYALEALANTKGKVPKDKLKEFANMVIDTRRKTIAQSIANGMPRDRAGVLADLAVKSEVISALSQYDINPMNVLDASINDALQSVGRNKTLTIKGVEESQQRISDSGFLSYLPIKMLEDVAQASGREGSAMQIFAKMLYGFALVPARVFHNVAWFSPYGFIRLGIDKYKKNKGEDSPYAMSLQTDAQYKQRLTETIAGSIAMLGLAALSSASSDEDDDKKFKIVITGNGPSATTDKQYFDSWMKKWKPYSVHIVVNGNIIPINIGRGGEALFFPIMLAGALDDWKIKQKQNLTKKEPEDLSAIAQMLGSSFFALAQRGPYAAFTKPLFDASKDGRVTEELASQAGFFGKTFIPVVGSSLARNISDLFSSPIDRSSIEGAIYANTPIVGPWLGTKALNALGQPIRADDWGDKLFKLGVPVVFSFPKDTPMNELNELILKQGSGPTIPTRANAQKRFGDILTDKEFETYVREYGRVMSDKMFKNRTRLANLKPADYDDELEKYARGYSIDGIKIKGASDSAVLAVKRMRQ